VWPQPFGRPVVKAAAASQRLARWWLLFVPGVILMVFARLRLAARNLPG